MSKRTLAARTLEHTGFGRLMRLARSWRGLLVLNYHRIGDGSRSPFDRNLWSASTEDFERQIWHATREFDIVGLEDLNDVLDKRRGRYLLITFDDGYLDNYTEAFPILKAYNTKATFFVTTGFLDVPQIPWWDEIAWMVRRSNAAVIPANPWIHREIPLDGDSREAAVQTVLKTYKRIAGSDAPAFMRALAEGLQAPRCPPHVAHELWMTWHMIREMEQAGMTIGGHSVNHPILGNLSPDEQEYEVGECQRRLTKELGHPARAFSYPIGNRNSYDIHTRKALQRHGFEWGFTFVGGHVRLPFTDRFAIPRAAVETDVDVSLFQAMLTLPQWFA